MLSNISWHSYWTVLAILSGIYYITILFIYYRQDLKRRLLKKGLPATGVPASIPVHPVTPDVHVVQSTLFDEDVAPDFQAPPADSAEYPVYACMDELNAFFEEAKARKWHKFALLHALRQILSKYPSLKDSEYRSSLGQVIQVQSEQYCSIHLKAEEVVGLW